MSERRYVNIVIQDNETAPFPQGSYSVNSRIEMDNKELKKYVHNTKTVLKNRGIPVSECVKLVKLKYNQNLCFAVLNNNQNNWKELSAFDDTLTVEIVLDPKNCKCGFGHCADNLYKGACTDKCVRKIIGTPFFPARYKETKQGR